MMIETGACLSCSYSKCAVYFHIQCAINNNYYVDLSEDIYCEKHAPINPYKVYLMNQISKKQQILKFSKQIHKIQMSQDYKKGRKKFLKRQYEEDDKIFESLLMKELKKREEFQFVVVLQKSYETGKVEYQFNHLRLPRPLILKLQIAQQDPIWNNIKFKNYSPIKIYRKYRALVKKHQQNKDYKQVRTQYRKNIKIYQDETLYCICRRKYKEDEPMIQCETCTQWFHFFCIGYIGTSEEASKMDQYICKNCEQNDNTLNQQRRFSKYKHLFLENQRKLSDEQKERIKRIQQAFKDIKTDT